MGDAPFGGGRDGFPCPQLQPAVLGDGWSLTRQPPPSWSPLRGVRGCKWRCPANAHCTLPLALLVAAAGWEAAEK